MLNQLLPVPPGFYPDIVRSNTSHRNELGAEKETQNTYRNSEISQAHAQFSTLARSHSCQLQIGQKFWKGSQAHAPNRIKSVSQLVCVSPTFTSPGHENFPTGLGGRESRVRSEGMEGIFMKRAFDDSSQRGECICEECEKGVEESIVGGRQERRCSERCKVREKAIFGLHTLGRVQTSCNGTTYFCNTQEVVHPGPEFFT